MSTFLHLHQSLSHTTKAVAVAITAIHLEVIAAGVVLVLAIRLVVRV
jgi:hypothetical protein